MPHIIVKLWPGKSEQQKQELADEIVKDVMRVLHSQQKSISVAFEEVAPEDWAEQVAKPEIEAKLESLYKKPGH